MVSLCQSESGALPWTSPEGLQRHRFHDNGR